MPSANVSVRSLSEVEKYLSSRMVSNVMWECVPQHCCVRQVPYCTSAHCYRIVSTSWETDSCASEAAHSPNKEPPTRGTGRGITQRKSMSGSTGWMSSSVTELPVQNPVRLIMRVFTHLKTSKRDDNLSVVPHIQITPETNEYFTYRLLWWSLYSFLDSFSGLLNGINDRKRPPTSQSMNWCLYIAWFVRQFKIIFFKKHVKSPWVKLDPLHLS